MAQRAQKQAQERAVIRRHARTILGALKPDAARQSGPVRIYSPADGSLRATISFEQFAARPSRLKALARGAHQPVSRG